MFRICGLLLLPVHLCAFEFFLSQDGTPYTWDLASLPDSTIRWRTSPADAPEILREAALFATQAWSNASAGVIQFAEGDGGIVIEWGAPVSSEGSLAEATVLARNGTILMATIAVNTANYAWVRGEQSGELPAGTANLDAVLLHELGHTLGLAHAEVPDDSATHDLPTMNAVCYSTARSLHLDDILGIRALYGIDAPLPALFVEASPASGRAPLKTAFFHSAGNEPVRWDFGDGTSAVTSEARHRYRVPGVYTVTAENNGMRATMTIEVTRKPKKTRRSLTIR
ncbi:MAG TPA: matrixin family metalloprotease [Planctomycetota bacterium]|nr:matrixin family metalloprotease [Planctomycetota bacterium]